MSPSLSITTEDLASSWERSDSILSSFEPLASLSASNCSFSFASPFSSSPTRHSSSSRLPFSRSQASSSSLMPTYSASLDLVDSSSSRRASFLRSFLWMSSLVDAVTSCISLACPSFSRSISFSSRPVSSRNLSVSDLSRPSRRIFSSSNLATSLAKPALSASNFAASFSSSRSLSSRILVASFSRPSILTSCSAHLLRSSSAFPYSSLIRPSNISHLPCASSWRCL
mmetsp:Transcript_30489/g.73580  ORF Transcript_30489/g.73580 Transcript_30489/m.73580 type:complete len:227 (-) Transcript_30489:1155-1835(-)